MDLLDFCEELEGQFEGCEEEYDAVYNNALKLMISLRDLRVKLKENEEIPLSPFESRIFDNLRTMSFAINQEIAKFCVPGMLQLLFDSFTEQELSKILLDNDQISELGLDEWIEEGLLDPQDYKIVNLDSYRK